MSSSLRRGALAATAIAISIASLSACAAGNNAETLQIKPDNAATSVGVIKIQNAVVITQPDPESDGPAMVSATIFNSGGTDQTLDSITVDGAGKAELKPAEGQDKVTIPAGGSLVIGGENNASAELTSPGEDVQDGNAQKVTFAFSETGEVSLRAFVFPAEGFYASWGPSDLPSPTATATETQSSEEGSHGDEAEHGTESPSASESAAQH
ncbi:DUF461 domain-containing protein [Streptomyces sp. NPDC018693]|uniref:DUF461 domain-containing protein n=1 Tax=unclassified Streptomyces TaxID=2593676 RepID=UPI0037950283